MATNTCLDYQSNCSKEAATRAQSLPITTKCWCLRNFLRDYSLPPPGRFFPSFSSDIQFILSFWEDKRVMVTSRKGVSSKVIGLESLQQGADSAQRQAWQHFCSDGAVCQHLLGHHQQICCRPQLWEERVPAKMSKAMSPREKKTTEYAFGHQFNEKPTCLTGLPTCHQDTISRKAAFPLL